MRLLLKRAISIVFLVVILIACRTTEAEWEAYYRTTCEVYAVQDWETRKPSEDEILHCMEQERSGIGVDVYIEEAPMSGFVD